MTGFGAGWPALGVVGLAATAVAIFMFLARRVRVQEGRLQPVPRHLPPGEDPFSGRPAWPAPLETPTSKACDRPVLLRVLLLLTLLAGLRYLVWRWQVVDWTWWWASGLLAAAETLAYAEIFLVTLSLWRMKRPVEPPPPLPNATVDVFITCYNEPVDLVRGTVRAAKLIRYPHRTFVLDDGADPQMAAMAAEEGVGYFVRSAEWQGRKRHAKAGNISNALTQTTGEFILFQDADQIPEPQILDRILGYFADPKVAFVQTPHWFYNAPPDDPLGSQQPIFYGPVLQGKDGFNAAFFCGSNGLIRREALMQAGVQQYAEVVEKRVRLALDVAPELIDRAEQEMRRSERPMPELEQGLARLRGCVRAATRDLAADLPLQDVTWRFHRDVEQISRELLDLELRGLELELADGVLPDGGGADWSALREDHIVASLLRAQAGPLTVFEPIRQLLILLDLHRGEEALPVLPFSTCSVTEDMATAMRIHAMGWKSVYHHEILARGLAPDDLRSSVSQRRRWAQGAFQINLRENPFLFRRLTVPQKLMYLHSALAYLSGFAIPIFLAAPVAYVLFGVTAVRADWLDMLLYTGPYLLACQAAYRFWTWGLDTWRAEQYAVAFFPVWIEAAWSAFKEAVGLDKLTFVVTPKTVQVGNFWGEVRWQLAFLALSLVTVVVGLSRIALGDPNPAGILLNVFWAWMNVLFLSVVVEAAWYRPAAVAAPEPSLAEGRRYHAPASAGQHVLARERAEV